MSHLRHHLYQSRDGRRLLSIGNPFVDWLSRIADDTVYSVTRAIQRSLADHTEEQIVTILTSLFAVHPGLNQILSHVGIMASLVGVPVILIDMSMIPESSSKSAVEAVKLLREALHEYRLDGVQIVLADDQFISGMPEGVRHVFVRGVIANMESYERASNRHKGWIRYVLAWNKLIASNPTPEVLKHAEKVMRGRPRDLSAISKFLDAYERIAESYNRILTDNYREDPDTLITQWIRTADRQKPVSAGSTDFAEDGEDADSSEEG